MQLSPTFPTRVLGVLALPTLVAAVAAQNAAAFGWSASLVIGIAISRMLTQQGIARARTAGFEMLWQHDKRSSLAVREGEILLHAELRNRSDVLLMLESITALSPPELEVVVEPKNSVLPAHSALVLAVRVRPLRVGIHGIQGVSVLVRSDSSAFEAELTFANPHVVMVMPSTTRYRERERRGGLGRASAPAARTGQVSGDSLELRELRDHQPGDPLRKVAWKASARRGRLLVRDDEQEHRHLVWFVLDASVELWSGRPGEAALDLAIDRVASLIHQALKRGDRVGLCVIAARRLALVKPDQGIHHEQHLFEVLARSTATIDHDRSGLDEQDAAAIVIEHLRPMDPAGTRRVSAKDLGEVATLCQRALARKSIVAVSAPTGSSARDQLFRQYIANFGLPAPPRTTADRDQTDRTLLETLDWLASQSPDRIRICSPWPRAQLLAALTKTQRRLRRSRIDLDWIPINVHYGMARWSNIAQQIVHETLNWRSLVHAKAGNLALRRLGILASTARPAVRKNEEIIR